MIQDLLKNYDSLYEARAASRLLFFIWLGLATGQMIVPKAQLSQTDKICNTNLVNLQGVCQISGQHEETSLYSLC